MLCLNVGERSLAHHHRNHDYLRKARGNGSNVQSTLLSLLRALSLSLLFFFSLCVCWVVCVFVSFSPTLSLFPSVSLSLVCVCVCVIIHSMSRKLNILNFIPPYNSWATKIKLNCKYINKDMMLAMMCVMLIMEEIRKV